MNQPFYSSSTYSVHKANGSSSGAGQYGLVGLQAKPLCNEGEDCFGRKGHCIRLQARSSLLLEKNPVHKMITVLIHNGKPICESSNIVQYIDETWNHEPLLLPSDPYQRSQARFWADYIDNNVYSIGKELWMMKGKEQEEGNKKFIECLKRLEGELGEKAYFGGEKLGYVDVALIPSTSWFYTYETFGNLSMEAECPKLMAWAKRCMQSQSVANSLPHPHDILEFAIQYKKKNGLE